MSARRRQDPDRPARDWAYLQDIHPAISGAQARIEREAAKDREPITERESARLLATLVRACGARTALEIGTNLGYSATWIAGALPRDGCLVCLDIDAEILERAREHLTHERVADKVELRCGAALDLLADLPGPFDFAYIDANKDDYPAYLEACVERLRPGGVVCVDNLLWGGQAAMETDDPNRPRQWTPIIRSFNRSFLDHPQLDSTIVQIGDGVGIGVKRG